MKWLTHMSALARARLAVCLFATAGVVGWMIAPDSETSLPLALFYATLTLHTYFSVRFFPTPPRMRDQLADIAIAICYLLVAIFIKNPIAFTFFAAGIFFLSVLKYSLLLGEFPHTEPLKRKIRVNLLGGVFCLAILLGILSGYALLSVWIFAIVFIIANIYLLLLNPLYRA